MLLCGPKILHYTLIFVCWLKELDLRGLKGRFAFHLVGTLGGTQDGKKGNDVSEGCRRTLEC